MTNRAKLLQIHTAWYYCDWEEPIPYDSRVWQPHNFAVTKRQTGPLQATRATLSVYDKRREIVEYSKVIGLTKKFLTLRYVEQIEGEWVEVDTHNSFSLPMSEAYGQYPNIMLECSAMAGLRRTPGLPAGSRTCRHVLKGLRCQYTGPDLTCFRDREHCRLVKLNLRHFGGYEWAAEGGTTINLGPVTTTIPDSPIGGRSYPPYLGGDSGTEADVMAEPPMIWDETEREIFA